MFPAAVFMIGQNEGNRDVLLKIGAWLDALKLYIKRVVASMGVHAYTSRFVEKVYVLAKNVLNG